MFTTLRKTRLFSHFMQVIEKKPHVKVGLASLEVLLQDDLAGNGEE